MAVFIIKFLFWALSSITDLLSFMILKGAAHLLVLVIRGFRMPGQTISMFLKYVADLFEAVFEYLLNLLIDAISSVISASFDLLIEAISGSVGSAGAAAGDLMGKMKMALDALPEVFEDASQTIFTILTSLWNNYKDAIGYVLENI